MAKPLGSSIRNNIRRLIKYDPAKTPDNLKQVQSMVQNRIFLSTWEKMDVVRSAVSYSWSNNIDLTPLALDIVKGNGGKEWIPATSIVEILRLQRKFQNDEMVVELWNSIQRAHSSRVESCLPLQILFLQFFGPKEKYRKLALTIASKLARSDNIHDPNVILAVVRTFYACGKYKIAAETASRVKVIDRSLAGALLLVYTAMGDKRKVNEILGQIKTPLSPVELGGLVKHLANPDIEDAIKFLDTLDSDPRSENRKQFAYVQLVNQAIHNKNKAIFDEYTHRLEKTYQHSRGVLMNLRIKWHYYHGTFDAAKLVYQLQAQGSYKSHRVIALNMLKDFDKRLPKDSTRKQWLETWQAWELESSAQPQTKQKVEGVPTQ